ncbi:rhodanese-like domain-containing protein [Maricaulaceae bacterium NA33B04]|nr:rhodanese-like domain-containing protein [Maricaulaceae bacterium NA33B04]
MQNWTPQQTAEALDAGEIILVDVREAGEYHEARIPGALLLPLSTFDPAALPVGQGRKVVLHCKAGGRSAKAIEACQAAGVDVDTHMMGGIGEWIAAGLPYFQFDPASGQMKRNG